MKELISGKSSKRIIAVFALGAALLAFGGGTAYAQAHDQRHEKHEFKDHQKMERGIYGNSAVRDHQRAEKNVFKNQERAERSGYYGTPYYGENGGYGYPPYGQSQYPSAHSHGYPWGHGGYSYPNPGGYYGNGYPSGHGGHRYPSGHTGSSGSYYPGQYHGNQHSQAGHDPYRHHDHH
jgi:hypothetical protein